MNKNGSNYIKEILQDKLDIFKLATKIKQKIIYKEKRRRNLRKNNNS
jgi:hypothetical protein